MIRDWRGTWGEGDFPFLYVQLANFTSTNLEDWPTIREAQRKTLVLRNTAMVVTIDIGNPEDVHPTNKQDVGARLALAGRAVAYGEAIEYSGPLFREIAIGRSCAQTLVRPYDRRVADEGRRATGIRNRCRGWPVPFCGSKD